MTITKGSCIKGAQVWECSSHGFFLFLHHKASLGKNKKFKILIFRGSFGGFFFENFVLAHTECALKKKFFQARAKIFLQLFFTYFPVSVSHANFSFSTSQSFLSRPWYFYVSVGHAYTLSSLSVYFPVSVSDSHAQRSCILYLSLSDSDAYYPFLDRTCILLQLANCEMMNVYQYKVAMFHISQALQLLHIIKTCLGNKK